MFSRINKIATIGFVLLSIGLLAQEWVDISPACIPNNIYGLDGTFKNQNEGWLIGIGELPQKLYHTLNGGKTWEIQMVRDSIFYSDIIFVDNEYGWMKISKWIGPRSNNEDYLWKTKDGGKTWEKVSTPPEFWTFTFIDSLRGVSGGGSGFCRTTDGGNTWQACKIDSDIKLGGVEDICFSDSQYGWAIGIDIDCTDGCGALFKTTNGGETWHRVIGAGFATDVFFTDSLHGVVLSAPGYMWTEDGGKTWGGRELPSRTNDVVFIDRETGWMVGDMGFIWKTVDGGKTWEKVESGTTNDLHKIVFVENGKVGFIFGARNTLLRYDAESVVLDEKRKISSFSFKLYPNYPNPFNGETKIEYELPQGGVVCLRIFNLTGEEVVTLVEGVELPGRYSVYWDGRDKLGKEVSSGVYLCHLEAAGFSSFMKLCMIR